MRAKKYLWSILCVYFCYLTHGIQAIILSQNNVNFAKQWGFNMTDPQSAAYAAGLAAVSTAVAWTGFGKFVSVWIGGEISDHVGRKKLMIGGAALYISMLPWILIYKKCISCFCMWICFRSCNIRFLGCIRISGCTGSLSGSTWICTDRDQIFCFCFRYDLSIHGCS